MSALSWYKFFLFIVDLARQQKQIQRAWKIALTLWKVEELIMNYFLQIALTQKFAAFMYMGLLGSQALYRGTGWLYLVL